MLWCRVKYYIKRSEKGEKSIFTFKVTSVNCFVCVYLYLLATSDPCQATHPHLETCYFNWGFSAIFCFTDILMTSLPLGSQEVLFVLPCFCRLAGPWPESLLPLPTILPQEGGASRSEPPPRLPFCQFWGLTQVFRLLLQVLLPTKLSREFFSTSFLLETISCCLS